MRRNWYEEILNKNKEEINKKMEEFLFYDVKEHETIVYEHGKEVDNILRLNFESNVDLLPTIEYEKIPR